MFGETELTSWYLEYLAEEYVVYEGVGVAGEEEREGAFFNIRTLEFAV